MQTFRFLLDGHRDPLAGVVWSDAWCQPPAGVVGYGAGNLHHWIAPELWRVELEGQIAHRELSVTAERGRLLAPVERWDRTACQEFLRWCIERHPSVSCDPDDQRWNAACDAGYDASQTAGMDATARGESFEDAEAAERVLQSAWVLARAGLG